MEKVYSGALVILLLGFGLTTFAQNQAPRIVIDPKGHAAKVNSLLYTPDGDHIISVSEDKTIRVWESSSGDLLNKFELEIGDGYEGMPYAATISPDGKLLAIAGYPVSSHEENYIVIIDVLKETQIAIAVGHENVINGLGFTADGRHLISAGDDGIIKIWSVSTGNFEEKASIEVGLPVAGLSVNLSNGRVAIATRDQNVLIYDLSGIDGNRDNYPSFALKKHKEVINKVCYSPDGKYLASCSFNNDLIVWDNNGEIIFQKEEFDFPLNALAFSYDSKVLVALDVVGRGFSFGLPGGILHTSDFVSHDNTVFSAVFSPQSARGNYVVASSGGTRNEIITWNAISAKTINTITGMGNFIGGLTFGKGMELFISTDFADGPVTKYQYSFDFNTFEIAKNPTLIPGQKKKEGAKRGKSTFELLPDRGRPIVNNEYEDGAIRSFTTTPEGNVIVGSDFSLKMYDASGNLMKEFLGHTGGVWAVAVSPDGRYFVSGSEDQTVKIWKLDESGYAPPMRDYFAADPDMVAILEGIGVGEMMQDGEKNAWVKAIEKVRSKGENKLAKFLQVEFDGLGEKVIPFANLFIANDGEWVLWVPTGYFTCSTSGADYFGWHINNGTAKLADYYSADQYFELLYRPALLSRSLVMSKRARQILEEDGEKIFDLTRLNRPSVGLFNINKLSIGQGKVLNFEGGSYKTVSRKLPLTVDIYDGGGGIREVNIYRNGKLIFNDTSLKSLQQNDMISKVYEVDLVNEMNEFRVVVVNYQGIESRSDHLKIEYTGEQIITASLHVLVVGINQYEKQDYNLNYAQSDARSFMEKFMQNSRALFKEVGNKIELYDREATKENIMKAFENIVAQSDPEDMFVFYYAGHGSVDEKTNEYYLVPTDITQLYGDSEQLKNKGISATELKTMLSRIKSTQQLILMDACHSGAAVTAFESKDEASRKKAITQLARSSGVAMLTASNSLQFATEFDSLKHGVFTYSLLEALDGAADTGDDKVSVYELKLYMEREVPRISRQFGGQAQKPVAHVFGNDFPISLVGRKKDGD